eukprot:CAMPEP_0201579114 /NCGR_PEP_ID=MMETSP0190_2-20130828/26428_1 /ASSEMBLY_ACC=CAM_ASM_000263 /TAXON_ID=37353 /ORGANISM="Rosalina sp." /LENGTH=162 /DNA_ID=CAMNT_0048013109 /DNA_START=216 /DNA_END=704 /DNA_ORIENTATION=-
MKIERLPIEEEIESKDYFGKQKSEKGFLWKGTITIYMKKLPKGMTIRNLYDSEGEDFFDGEKAKKQKAEENENEKPETKPKPAEDDAKVREDSNDNEDNTKGNGAVKVKDDEDNKSESIEMETQIYEVELVISKEDPIDKDKDLKKRILSAMNNSSNASTPR